MPFNIFAACTAAVVHLVRRLPYDVFDGCHTMRTAAVEQ